MGAQSHVGLPRSTGRFCASAILCLLIFTHGPSGYGLRVCVAWELRREARRGGPGRVGHTAARVR